MTHRRPPRQSPLAPSPLRAACAGEEGRSEGRPGPYDRIPDVRDGLTRVERVVLYVLHEAQRELGGRNVPTAMLYGRVVEHVNISQHEFQAVLTRMVGRR